MIFDFFELNHPFSSQSEAIHYICEQLKKKGAVDDSFEKEVFTREQIETTAFHNLIALPHAFSSSVKRNAIYLVLNKKPTFWGKNHVNLIVFIAIQEELLADFYCIYGLLIDQFSTPKNIKKLLDTKDYSSFLNTLTTLEETI